VVAGSEAINRLLSLYHFHRWLLQWAWAKWASLARKLEATGSDNIIAPSRHVSWFATGVRTVDDTLPAEYWSGDT